MKCKAKSYLSTIGGIALSLITIFSLTGCTSAPAPALPPTSTSDTSSLHTVSVNSEESIKVIPDVAEVIYSVRTESLKANDCQQKNTDAVNMVIATLKELGIEETSIQSSAYYLNPLYSYNGNKRTTTGYEAISTLTVSDIPLTNLGTLLTQSVGTGVNTIDSVSYYSSKYDENYQEALALAVASAKAKAQVLAEAGGRKLGTITNIQEVSNYGTARYTDNVLPNMQRAKEEMNIAADAAPVNIMPGELEIQVNITAQYELQ